MQRLFFLIFTLVSFTVSAQTKNDVEIGTTRKAKNWDTLKYQKFETVLIVGVFQQHRTFSNEFKQEMNPTDTSGLSSHTYSTEINFAGATGITISYDKFQLSLAKRIEPKYNNAGKGATDMFNIGLNVGDNRWVSENYFRRFKGFYNTSTPTFDTNFKYTKQYDQQPSMISSLFMTRFMYFKNYENYSFKSGFGCNYRQLKSALTLIHGGSFSVYNLRNDSAIIPLKARYLYNDYGSMRGLRSVNLSYNIGLAATIVLFKAWFIGGYFTLGPEQQWRNYDLTSEHRRISYISFSGTGRLSMGLNMKKFYMIWGFSNDYNTFNSKKIMTLKTSCYTSNFTFGWRFHYHTPKFYQKFQQTKLYQYL